MNDRELKKYAITGILVRIQGEKNKLNNAPTESRRQQIECNIDRLKEHYIELYNELNK